MIITGAALTTAFAVTALTGDGCQRQDYIPALMEKAVNTVTGDAIKEGGCEGIAGGIG